MRSGAAITARENGFRPCRRRAAGVRHRVRFRLLVSVDAVSRSRTGSGSDARSSSGPCAGASGSQGRHDFIERREPRRRADAVGTRVMFVNNDSIPHDIMGGPDPARPDCHEIDAVGFLTPGQSRQTAPFPQARLCEYHDHSYHSTLFNGRILIQ